MPPEVPAREEAVRFLDILTTASSVARARGAEAVGATHLLEALAVLGGGGDGENGGDLRSPLGHRRAELVAESGVRELTQRWFARLGATPEAALEASELAEFRAEVEALVRS